jgi:hypothetical protein
MYHIKRLPAHPLAAAKRRALVALALAAGLSGCAVSMPLPGFIDETSTSSVQPKALATPPAAEQQVPGKSAVKLASTQAAD